METKITCKEFFIPQSKTKWNDYKACSHKVDVARLNNKVGQVFQGILATALFVGGALLTAFVITSTAVLLPISLSILAAGSVALIISIAFGCLAKQQLKGYKPEVAQDLGSAKFLELLKDRKADLKDEEAIKANKFALKGANKPIFGPCGIVSKYDWTRYPKKLNKALAVRSLNLSHARIVELLEVAFEKKLTLKFYRYHFNAIGTYHRKDNAKDGYERACKDADEYAAQFAASILSKDPNTDLKLLNEQIDQLRQTCYNDPKLRCPFIFEILRENLENKIILKKRDEPKIDLNSYKKIFEDKGLKVVEMDKTVTPD